jgi:hypothetical protein
MVGHHDVSFQLGSWIEAFGDDTDNQGGLTVASLVRVR